jgi:pimeloyl-ACP methyl ester carboxylesterase
MLFGDQVPSLPGFLFDAILELHSDPRMSELFDSTVDGPHLDERVGELAVRTDLIWGEGDPFFPLDYARRLDALLPNSSLHVLPGCGHAPQITCPERFAAELRDVLAER